MLLSSIPFVDLRDKTLVDLLRSYPDKARTLIGCARRMYGIWSRLASVIALPLADRLSYAWLRKTNNPYLHEIETMADILETKGAYSIGLSYEWGCTSGVYRQTDTVPLLRVLDWPFPDLGKHVMVVRLKTKAGDYYNVTWPGISGVFTAMAPGRFSAAINMAPMRKHRRGLIGDWLTNRRIANHEMGLPASHLLRQVFEQANDYEHAKEMLLKTPIATPAIFILAGTEPGQGCVIERLENAAEFKELSAETHLSATNHFVSKFAGFGEGWRPRMVDSQERYQQSDTIAGHELEALDFSWLRAPMLNRFTRLCVVADAATSRLMVQGFSGVIPVTGVFQLPSSHLARDVA
ncbi:MAG: hypothetical protein SFT92_05415 [Rickettsiales bacterium]|nr:hypothetical protein [Rickettsiales bacterium]